MHIYTIKEQTYAVVPSDRAPPPSSPHRTIRAIQLDHLIGRDPPLLIPDPSRGVERVHFYLVYRGGNQRAVQEKVARCADRDRSTRDC